MAQDAGPVKVFCCHRSVDKPRVEAFARRLIADGIDAFFDKFEIGPGDNYVTIVNRGLDEADIGLIFLSSSVSDGGKVFAQESTVLTHDRMYGDTARVIPVLLDDDAVVPALLRPLDRRRVDDYDIIRDMLLGRPLKPVIGKRPDLGTRTPFRLQLREIDGAYAVDLRSADGSVIASASGMVLPPTINRSLNAFLGGGEAMSARWAASAWRQLDEQLVVLGRTLGGVLFAGPVGETLTAALANAASGDTFEVSIEAEGALLMLPFEAARLPDDQVLALHPRVRVTRRSAGLTREPAPALPGPLKILVAVASPTDGAGELLDYEREMSTVLAALEGEASIGRAQVRFLDAATRRDLGRALADDSYHVVHLSGHGTPSAIILECEDGTADECSARDLAAILVASGRPLPLVTLAACYSATPSTDNASLAAALIANGIDRVLAMQSRVTDRYATELVKAVYERLGRDEQPRVGAAVANARQQLEQQRRSAGPNAGDLAAAEYATATLVVAGADSPILDNTLERVELTVAPVHAVHDLLPQLSIDDFIGRRSERRELLRLLRDPIGRSGAAIVGMGGVGKSALAAQVALRLVNGGWVVAVVSGRLRPEAVAVAVADAVRNTDAALAEELREAATTEAALPSIRTVLRNHRVLLVLDDFEQNLSLGGEQFTEEGAAALLAALLSAAKLGRVLITCRYPIPGFDLRVASLALSPLSPAETGKLLLRLRGLSRIAPEERRRIVTAVGGHPRILELVDALVRTDTARPTILAKLEALAAEEAVRLRRRPDDHVADVDDAIRLAQRDVLLTDLIEMLGPDERSALWHIAPTSLPITAEDVASLVGCDTRGAEATTDRLSDLSLVYLAGNGVLCHRWTAEALANIDGDRLTDAARAVGQRRLEQGRADQSWTFEVDALACFLTGRAWDEAAALAEQLCRGPFVTAQLTVAALAGETAAALPSGHQAWARVNDLAGQADLACGFTNSAIVRYDQLRQIQERLADTEPDRADYQLDVVRSLHRFGQQLAETSHEGAFNAWKEALDLAAPLAEQQPDRPDIAVDVAVSLYLLSQLVQEAAPLLAEALRVLEQHGERLPDNGRRLLEMLTQP